MKLKLKHSQINQREGSFLALDVPYKKYKRECFRLK
jgi:hypothetical protein